MAKKKKRQKKRPVEVPDSEAARRAEAERIATLSAAAAAAVPEEHVRAPRSEEDHSALAPARSPDVGSQPAVDLMTTPTSRATDRASAVAGGSDAASPWSVYGTPATGVLRGNLSSAFDSPATAEEQPAQEPRDDAASPAINTAAELMDARQDAEDRVAQVRHAAAPFPLTFPWMGEHLLE